MLLEYGIKNYFTFKEGAVVKFQLPVSAPSEYMSDTQCSYVIGVKGKNGAGKTQLLKGLAFLSDFCSKSFERAPDREIDVESFYYNKNVVEFYIVFNVGEIIYTYELEAKKDRVIRETLYRKDKRKTKIIERKDKFFTLLTSDYEYLGLMKLRSNASFISISKQYEFERNDTINDVYNFFSSIFSNISKFGLMPDSIDVSGVSEMYRKFPDYFEFVKGIIKECDTDVSDIKIIKYKTDEDAEDKYAPVFEHLIDGKTQPVTYYMESSGTKSLYTQLARYKIALDLGGVLCLDEFDINYHPHILPHLISLFSKENNKNDAQFIFTTHNNDVLDFLGKYRAYLVDKEQNESFIYRLDELPGDILRNDRSIIPVYNSGKIGGVPKI